MFIEPEEAFGIIKRHWTEWDSNVKPEKYIIGISGGVDSTCAAALACKLFGKDKVIGVSLPCNGQKDMQDVDKVFTHLGIKRITIDIGEAFDSLKTSIAVNGLAPTHQCVTNMPARLRMAALFGVAQCLNGVVVNTCNRSEDIVGYSTLFGDDAGCYSPLKNLTKTEVQKLAFWLIVPANLAYKTPVDGLQDKTDEESLGFTYAELDTYIRGDAIRTDVKQKIDALHAKNKFKLDIINIPGPKFNAADAFNYR